MASQGATLQNYNNELVKCAELCLRRMPVKKVRRAGGAGRAAPKTALRRRAAAHQAIERRTAAH